MFDPVTMTRSASAAAPAAGEADDEQAAKYRGSDCIFNHFVSPD